MELHLSEGRIPVGYARFGSIWKKGEVTESDFRLWNEAGEEVPVQSKAAAFWPDGSIKWAFHEADSARMGKQVRLTCHCLFDPVEHQGASFPFNITKRCLHVVHPFPYLNVLPLSV